MRRWFGNPKLDGFASISAAPAPEAARPPIPPSVLAQPGAYVIPPELDVRRPDGERIRAVTTAHDGEKVAAAIATQADLLRCERTALAAASRGRMLRWPRRPGESSAPLATIDAQLRFLDRVREELERAVGWLADEQGGCTRRTCPACGLATLAADAFCPACGRRLAASDGRGG